MSAMITSNVSGIAVKAVRVRNYRALQNIEVQLDPLTILIGENNAGKTSFLDALNAAIGASRKAVSPDDITLLLGEKRTPKDRQVTVDLLIRPVDNKWVSLDAFPEGSAWSEVWGTGIQQDSNDNDREFVAIRFRYRWDDVKADYISERFFLSHWADFDERWTETQPFNPMSRIQSEFLQLYFMDANRDIEADIRAKTSFWGRLLSDTGFNDDNVKVWEDTLTRINEEMVSSSGVLSHLKSHLEEVSNTIQGSKSGIAIDPMPRSLRDISRGMDVQYASDDSAPFSLYRQGMGTRSLASIMIFRAYTAWRDARARRGEVHSILALEEPEAHLHPQAQRALYHQISSITGQLIVSTHSPYIASQCNIGHLRHFRKKAGDTSICQLNMGDIDPEDVRKVERMVMNTRGDILFSRALVLFEGETEEQAIPLWAKATWRRDPHSLGVSFVGVGGSGNYLPFLRLAECFKIPWFIFSDGDKAGKQGVEAALARMGLTVGDSRVYIIDGNRDYERYLADSVDSNMLVDVVTNMDPCDPREIAARVARWNREADLKVALAKFMGDRKTECGQRVTAALIEKGVAAPTMLNSLLVAVQTLTAPKRQEG